MFKNGFKIGIKSEISDAEAWGLECSKLLHARSPLQRLFKAWLNCLSIELGTCVAVHGALLMPPAISKAELAGTVPPTREELCVAGSV